MTIKDYDKVPPLPTGLKLEGEKELPPVPKGLVLGDVEKKSQVGGVDTKLNGGGQESLKTNEEFPLLYGRDKGQMKADMRPSGIVPLEINQEQERQFNRLKRGFEDTTSAVVNKPVAETVRQTVPKEIKDGVIKDKEKDDSVIGGVYNSIVGSVSRLVGGMVEAIETIDKPLTRGIDNILGIEEQDPSKIVWGNDPNRATGRELVTEFIDKARTASSSKANEQARSQFDITNGVQASDVKALLFQAPSVILDMVGGAYSGGTTFFFQSVNDNAKELQESGGYDKLTENEKIGYLFVQGTVQAALEKFGIDKILKATGLSSKVKGKIANEVTQEFIDKGVKATAADIEKAVLKKVSSLPNQMKRVGTKGATGFVAELGTEALQRATSDGVKLLTNKISGKDIFDEEDITVNFIKNVINAGAQGGVFGGVGGTAVGSMQNTNKALREQVSKAQTPEDIEKIRTDIAEQVELGSLTEEEANAANITVEQYAKVAAKIPTDVDAEQKYTIIGGIEQRESIKKEIEKIKKGNENLDPAFHESSRATLELLEAKLEQTNDYLEGVIAGKKTTYRKEKPTTEGGDEKYYKTSPNGEETKITKEHYDLATAVREEQAAKNKEEKEKPEHIKLVEKAVSDGKIKGMWAEMAEKDPEGLLQQISKQSQNLNDDFAPHNDGLEEQSRISAEEQFGNKLVEAAINLYPKKEAIASQTQSEGAAENVVPSTLKDVESSIFEKSNQNESSKSTQKLSPDGKEIAKENIQNVSNASKVSEKSISDKVDKLTDDEIKNEIDDIGYTITGRNLFYKKAQEIYHREVMTWDELDALPLKQKPQAQKDFDKWIEQHKRRILKEALIEQKASPTNETKAEKESPINAEPNKTGEGSGEGGEGETLRLSHADTEQIYKEAGLPERLATPTKHREQLDKEVDEMLSKGYDFDKVANEVMEGKRQFEDKDQVAFARKVADLKAKQKGLDIKSPEFESLQTEIEKLSRASDVAGTIGGRMLQSRKDYVPVEETISDFVIQEKEITKSDILTDQQKETVQKEFDAIKKAEQAWKDKYEALKAAHDKALAEKEVKKTASTAKKSETRDFKKERESFREELKAAKEKHEKWLKDQGIQKSGVGFTMTTDMAKAIAKIAKSHVEEGITKLADVVKKTIDDVKDIFGDISEKDVMEVLAGKYNEKKKPRKELAIQMQDLKTEVELIEKLDKILNGEEPSNENKKQQRNKQISDLRNKIKDIRGFESEKKKEEQSNLSRKSKTAKELEVDLSRAEKELQAEENRKAKSEEIAAKKSERDAIRQAVKDAKDEEKRLNYKTPEQRALASLKTKMANEISKIQEQLRTGDFAKEEKKEPVPLDAEGLKLKDQLIRAKNERKLRQLKEFYANQSNYEKGVRAAIEIANIPRALMATLDFSALLRQAIIPTIARPRTALRIEKGKFQGSVAEMFRGAASQKLYDRWFSDLAESPRFEGMKKSDLAITDSTDPNLQAREEAFMSGLADKIPLVGKTLIKGSERAYSMGLNKIRVDLYNRFADAMENRGLTVENSPKQYKEMAAYINNSTGRGDIGATLNKAAPILNALFFSPRLIASRLNMLTYLAQPRFYRTVPKEVRKAYYRDMAKFIGLGITVLALAKLGGADVEDDPRSSDFGKIKAGNTRWDIWGGFQQYARVFSQMVSGQKKSTNSGEIQSLDGEGRFGTTRGDVVNTFGRGKLAPVPSMAVDILSGRNIMGEKLTTDWKADEPKEVGLGSYLAQHFLPLNATGLAEALKDQGVKALFTVGVPSTFGIGVQTYESKPPIAPSTKKESKPKRTNQRKQTKQD